MDRFPPRTSLSAAPSNGTAAVPPPDSAEPTPARPTPLPGWASVGEALTRPDRPTAVLEMCRVVGRDLAEGGAPLSEGLEGLRSTTLLTQGREPTFRETQAVAEGWADATLAWIRRLSCTEPATGLATLAHLRQVLDELARGQPDQTATALVVVQLPAAADRVALAGQLSRVAAMATSAFPAARTVARLAAHRVGVLTPDTPALDVQVSLLDRMLDGAGWAWVEPMPPAELAGWFLDDLAG